MSDETQQHEIVEESIGGMILAGEDPMPTRTVELTLPPIPKAPTSFDLIPHVATLARMVAHTDFVPAVYRGRPAAVAACILMGHEIGLQPFTAMRHITITPPDQEGKNVVVMSAAIMRGIVLGKGHRLWYPELSSNRVTVAGQRRGEEEITRITWTMDDAKRAAPRGFGSSHSPWTKYPRAMLTARATAELCRLIFADVMGGVSYTPEEIDDGIESTVRDEDGQVPEPEKPVTPTHKRSRTSAAVVATPAAAPAPTNEEAKPEPAAVDPIDLPVPGDELPVAQPPAPPAAAAPAEPTQDEAQKKRNQMVALAAKEAGVVRGELCNAASRGRTASAKELTPDEAAWAIDTARAITRGEFPDGIPSRDEPLPPPVQPVQTASEGGPPEETAPPATNRARELADFFDELAEGEAAGLRWMVLRNHGWSTNDGNDVALWAATLPVAKLNAIFEELLTVREKVLEK